ncbi:hypothetical protein LguiB_029578 [Lonicera macranthoides]
MVSFSILIVSKHLTQKLKLLSSGPTMYIILFNTLPHVQSHSHVDRQTKPNAKPKVHSAQIQRGKQMQARRFELKTL